MKSEKRCLICKSAWVRKELLTEPTNILKSVSIAISGISSLSVLPYFVPATLKEKLRWHESSICGDIRQHFRPWFSDFSPFSLFSHFFLFLIIFTLFSVQSDEDYQPSLFPLYPLCRPLVHIVHLVLLQTQRRPHSISVQKTASIAQNSVALLWSTVDNILEDVFPQLPQIFSNFTQLVASCSMLWRCWVDGNVRGNVDGDGKEEKMLHWMKICCKFFSQTSEIITIRMMMMASAYYDPLSPEVTGILSDLPPPLPSSVPPPPPPHPPAHLITNPEYSQTQHMHAIAFLSTSVSYCTIN